MSLLEDILAQTKPEISKTQRGARSFFETLRRIGELPSRALLGSDFGTIQGAVGAGEETRPMYGVPEAETFGEKASEFLGAGLAEAAVTAPGAAVSGLARGAGAVFDATIDAFLGAAATPEAPLKGALAGSLIGGGAGFGLRTLARGRPSPKLAPEVEVPTAKIMVEPPKIEALTARTRDAYIHRAWKSPETREADKALRSLFESGGVTSAERELQDNMIRSLPKARRLAMGKSWSEIADVKLGPKTPPLYREGLRRSILEQTAEAKEYALRTQAQRDEVFKGLAQSVQDTVGSKLIKTAELEQVRHVLSRLDGETIGAIRESMESLPTAARSRFATLLTGEICASPCKPIAEVLEQPGSWASVIREIRQAAMLSSPNTWLRNIFSTLGRISINPARSAAAGILDVGRAAALGMPRERYVGEAFAELAGLWNGVKAAAKRKSFQSSMPEDLIDFGVKTRAIREFGSMKPSALAEKFGEQGAQWGRYTQAPFKALNWQDEFMFTMAYSGEMHRAAYRQAVKEGLKGRKAFDRVGEILQQHGHSLKDLHKRAIGMAQEQVAERALKIQRGRAVNPLDLDHLALQEWRRTVDELQPDVSRAREMAERAIFIAREGKRLDSVISSLDGMDQRLGGLVSVALPFRRTPANVMRETIRSSPVGLVTPFFEAGGVRKALTGPAVGETLDRLGQATVGTAALYGLLAMADVGLIKAEAFGREKSRANRLTKEAAGVGQDALRVGNWSIPMDRMEPLGTLVLSAARAKELHDSGDVQGAIGMAETAAWEMVKRSADSAFMESLSQFFEAATSEDAIARRFMQRLGASFAPATLRDIRRVFDPALREVEPGEGYPGPSALVKETAKGFLGTLGVGDRPKLGTFGKERKAGLILGVKSPTSPIAQELVNIGVSLDIPKLPTTVDAKSLDSSERETFIKAKGQMQEYALKRLMASQRYSTLSEEVRGRLARSVVDKVDRRINKRATALKARGRKWTTRDLLRGFIQTGT